MQNIFKARAAGIQVPVVTTGGTGTTSGGDVALEIGKQVMITPSHIDTTINLHDYYCHRQGKIDAIVPIANRGKVK
ncbi:hypothetical protein KA183_19855 [bacterium]|nr:hypothetical protein [bacterium]